MTHPNPLIEQAAKARHGACCADQICRVCGSHVSTYNVKPEPLMRLRPESKNCDFWVACDNADCAHSYGENFGKYAPDWVHCLND